MNKFNFIYLNKSLYKKKINKNVNYRVNILVIEKMAAMWKNDGELRL